MSVVIGSAVLGVVPDMFDFIAGVKHPSITAVSINWLGHGNSKAYQKCPYEKMRRTMVGVHGAALKSIPMANSLKEWGRNDDVSNATTIEISLVLNETPRIRMARRFQD